MKWHISAAVIAVLCLGLFCSFPTLNSQVKAAPADQRITVLNPLGTPPPITLKPMAPRLDALDGKTIYVVDDGFVGGANLLTQFVDWFGQHYPKTKVIFKRKGGGGFEAEDPQLWAEIKQNGNAVIIGMGH